MNNQTRLEIAGAVKGVYEWIYVQLDPQIACEACGKCCDFDAYGHSLFVTTPELIYYDVFVPRPEQKSMTGDLCPYWSDGKCGIREHRFAACRIFYCKHERIFQNALSEAALEQFKLICKEYGLEYRYMHLKKALEYLKNADFSP